MININEGSRIKIKNHVFTFYPFQQPVEVDMPEKHHVFQFLSAELLGGFG